MSIIKQILKNKGITQNQLSHLARLPASNLSQVINGKAIPCPAWRKRISGALNVPEEILFPLDTLPGRE